MRWVDHITEDPLDADTFFDRAVMISMVDAKAGDAVLAPGILVTKNKVLSSFNPFRKFLKNQKIREKMIVSALISRQISDWKTIKYSMKNRSIACARQIIPVLKSDELWHGDKKENSPLHDLIVIRVKKAYKVLDSDPSLYSIDFYAKSGISARAAGPIITEIPNNSERLGREIKFASLGFFNQRHMKENRQLRTHTFEAEDNVEVNCDEWIPREWGRFICISNVENFKGVGSGALLVYDSMVFGIGSFFLKKGNKSILVFTDVRKYYDLIYLTCTYEDQNLIDVTKNNTRKRVEDL